MLDTLRTRILRLPFVVSPSVIVSKREIGQYADEAKVIKRIWPLEQGGSISNSQNVLNESPIRYARELIWLDSVMN